MATVLSIAVGLISCQQEDFSSSSKTSLEDFVKTKKFTSLNKRLYNMSKSQNTLTRGIENNINVKDFKREFTVIICSWDWGRPKHKCKGFGFCNFTWFPDFKSQAMLPNLDTIEYNGSLIEADENGRKYTDVLFDEEIDSLEQKKLPALAIDKRLSFTDSIDNVTKTYTIEKGMYEFNPKLGTHGGYRVYIQEDNE